jgi:hypothetical protein
MILKLEIFESRPSVLEMARRLGKRSDYLKAFSSGVFHESKTSLSSIKINYFNFFEVIMKFIVFFYLFIFI